MDDILSDARRTLHNYSHPEVGWATRPPDGVIIMSTSDVVTGGMARGVPWAFGSPGYYAHQEVYTAQLTRVVEEMRRAKVPVAIASPGTVETEGPLFAPSRYQGEGWGGG